MTDNFKEITNELKKELAKDVKEYQLSGTRLVNFFYDNYTEQSKAQEFLQLSDRNNANQKSNEHLINWLSTERYSLVSDQTMQNYGLSRPAPVSNALNAMQEARSNGYAEFDGKAIFTSDFLDKMARQDNRIDVCERVANEGAPLWQQDLKKGTLSPVYGLREVINGIPQNQISERKRNEIER